MSIHSNDIPFPPSPEKKRWVSRTRLSLLNSSSTTAHSDTEVSCSGGGPTSSEPSREVTPEPTTLYADVQRGLSTGEYVLSLCHEGEGGTYLVVPAYGQPKAVFKPSCEEIGCRLNPKHNTTDAGKPHFVPGTGYRREILAYLLDHDHVANVPETVEFEDKGRVGSLQRFVPNARESWTKGPRHLSVDSVHYLGILDLRTMNADRHGGNILVDKGTTIVPIDHSYILPPGFQEPDFEWLTWPQSLVPFSSETLQYIRQLDAQSDAAIVAQQLPDEPAAATVLIIGTMLLQTAALQGYCLREIGLFCRRETLTQPSGLELAIAMSRSDLDDGGELNLVKLQQQLSEAFPPIFTEV